MELTLYWVSRWDRGQCLHTNALIKYRSHAKRKHETQLDSLHDSMFPGVTNQMSRHSHWPMTAANRKTGETCPAHGRSCVASSSSLGSHSAFAALKPIIQPENLTLPTPHMALL